MENKNWKMSTMSKIFKGQIAVEFFIYASIFLLVILAAYFTVFFMQTSEISAKESLYLKWFGESFASNINAVMSSQKGFNYTMKFEPLILGKPYTIQFKPANATHNGFVFITWSENNMSYIYPIGNMSIKNAGSCVAKIGDYYNITISVRNLNFYNDGENITLSQQGCP